MFVFYFVLETIRNHGTIKLPELRQTTENNIQTSATYLGRHQTENNNLKF